MMDVQLSEISKYLTIKGYKCRFIDEVGSLYIDIFVNEKPIKLKLTLPLGFPYKFPRIEIAKQYYDKYKPLPHVNKDRSICLFDKDRSIPNIYSPNKIVLESIVKASKILESGINKVNFEDFEDEFNAYWGQDVRAELICTLDRSSKYLYCYKRNEKYICISDDKIKLKNYLKYGKGWETTEKSFQKALYLHLDKKLKIPYPDTNKKILSFMKDQKCFDDYRHYLKNNKEDKIIIFSQSLNNQLYFGGWRHKKNKTPKGFRDKNIDINHFYNIIHGNDYVKRFSITQLGHKRIFFRGGDGEINSIKVSVTGCGAIGSNLVNNIVNLGINDFILIDNDYMKSDNIGRHFCGASFIGKSKVESIKEKLISHYGDINCESINRDVFEVIDSETDLFNTCDYNFIVTGNLSVEQKFLDMYNSNKIIKPLIIIWVEPYLMGGHAIIVQEKQDLIELLFDENYHFKNSILCDGDKYIKKEFGCQGSFIPYSAFEIQLFLNDILDYINQNLFEKELKGNYLLSWIGRIDKARKSRSMEIRDKWIISESRDLKVQELSKHENIQN